MELENYKVIVFDLGGTLMEYEGMPLNWSDYYYQGFMKINEYFGLGLSDTEIEKSAEILKSYNPRNKYRENEIMPVVLFDEAMAGWSNVPDIREAIEVFFSGIGLKAKVFDYSIKIIKICKKQGIKIACLTDLPNGMPDSLFRDSIPDIIKLFDLYVSSQTCGYRKPNKAGLEYIAEKFGIDVKDILLVGDEDKDRKTADNAGCSFLYIDEFKKYVGTEISEKKFEKKKELFLEQKKTLDTFLKTGAISRTQYDKSYGNLIRKMGMESVTEELKTQNREETED
ncbi:MAG: HAD-IA family hydrolase [Lachnospiraceae bacterium]|nr:HAD-IA family hydrolase [Lachnospiraceae bacterium]